MTSHSYVVDYSKKRSGKTPLYLHDVPSALNYNPSFKIVHNSPKACKI